MIRHISYVHHCQKLPGTWDAVILAKYWPLNRQVTGHVCFSCLRQKTFCERSSSVKRQLRAKSPITTQQKHQGHFSDPSILIACFLSLSKQYQFSGHPCFSDRVCLLMGVYGFCILDELSNQAFSLVVHFSSKI